MPYQPYQSTWTSPYVQQTSYPQYLPVLPSQTQAYAQPVNGIIKVNGLESARQYQLPPNSMSPALFDQNGKSFYVVSTDGTGAKTVESFDFTPHAEEEPLSIDGAQFVSRKEFDEFAAKVNAVIGATNVVHAAVPAADAQHANVAASLDTPRGHVGDGE